MKAIFILCALALPPENKVSEVAMFKRYLAQYAPGYEFKFSMKDHPRWEKIGIIFNDHQVYRRKIGGAA